jgi:hypothetical protein
MDAQRYEFNRAFIADDFDNRNSLSGLCLADERKHEKRKKIDWT